MLRIRKGMDCRHRRKILLFDILVWTETNICTTKNTKAKYKLTNIQVWWRLHFNLQLCRTSPIRCPSVSSFPGWVLLGFDFLIFLWKRNKFLVHIFHPTKINPINPIKVNPPHLKMPLNPAPLDRQLWGEPRQSEHPFPWKLKFLTQFLHHRSEFTNLMRPKDMGWTYITNTLINGQKKDVAMYNKKMITAGNVFLGRSVRSSLHISLRYPMNLKVVKMDLNTKHVINIYGWKCEFMQKRNAKKS